MKVNQATDFELIVQYLRIFSNYAENRLHAVTISKREFSELVTGQRLYIPGEFLAEVQDWIPVVLLRHKQ